MKKHYFVPVSLNMLPEYFSSGFIGLTASKEPEQDLQSIGYPNILATKTLTDIQSDVFFEIEIDDNAQPFSMKDMTKYYVIPGPISIARITKTHFTSEDEKENFISTYSMLPDMPLDLFEFVTAPGQIDGTQPVDNNKLGLTTRKMIRRKRIDNPGDISVLVIGAKEAFCWLSGNIGSTAGLSVLRANKKKTYASIINHILKVIECRAVTPEHSFKLLEYYYNAVDSRRSEGKIDPAVLVHSMLNLAKKTQQASEEDNPENQIIVRFLEKTRNILLGIEARPDLDDDKGNLILQRAIYLACTANNLESFNVLRRNLRIGSAVENIAKLLVIYRTKLSYLSKDVWRSNRDQLNSVLLSAEKILSEKKVVLEIDKQPHQDDFFIEEKISINEITVANRLIEPSNDFLIIVGHLKELRYNPRPNNEGNAEIEVHEMDDGSFVRITIGLQFCPKREHNYKVSSTISGAASLFNRKASREYLLSLGQEFMLSVGIAADNKSIELSRYQLATTADRDELQHHIALVSGAYTSVTEYINKIKK